MKKLKEFPFESSRKVSAQEVRQARLAIEKKIGKKRPARGRPLKTEEKYKPVSIRIHPKVLEWAKREAKKKGVGYQTIINQVLLNKCS